MSTLTERYWLDDGEAPFATMLGVIDASCHPEAHAEAYEELIEAANDPDPGPRMRKFREELRSALQDTRQLPEGAVFTAAFYEEPDDEAFLRRLWRDLYGDEPV